MKFRAMRSTKVMRASVCEEPGSEILVYLDSKIALSIVSPNFPLPMDPKKRAHKIRNV